MIKKELEKDKEIERIKLNYRIGKANLQNKYNKLKNRLMKYPIQFDGCLIKNEKQLLEYANELVKDYEYMAKLKEDYKNNQKQLAIEELEKLKKEMFEGKCQMWLNIATNEYVINHRDKSIIDYIDKQINELKGDK